MAAKVIKISATLPDPKDLDGAVALLRAGEVVVFPTETVYGLGANALSSDAVARIYEVKGRPAHNPVIVHVPGAEAARQLVREWPPTANTLADAFWPGPLTLVLPRGEMIPDIVTAGGDTVAIRVPNHPIALALLNACKLPLAAPSANRSLGVSPTTAEHVLTGLGDRIPMIIDGGPCAGGIESTVVLIDGDEVRILRPGLVTREEIEGVLGKRVSEAVVEAGQPLQSPGQLERHYSPRARLVLSDDSGANHVAELITEGRKTGWMPIGEVRALPNSGLTIPMPPDPLSYAARLYSALHQMDAEGMEVIVCERPPDTAAWEAIRDRLRRAAS